METSFGHTLEREVGDIEVTIMATAEVSPRDPDVGIMNEGVEDINVTATDQNDKVVDLTDTERERIEKLAEDKFYDMLPDL